jgi:hypothetical protein
MATKDTFRTASGLAQHCTKPALELQPGHVHTAPALVHLGALPRWQCMAAAAPA